MRCPACGLDNPEEYRYCGRCGAPSPAAGRGQKRDDAGAPSHLGLGVARRDDDDLDSEPVASGGGWGKLLLLILVVVVGIVLWLRWRSGPESGELPAPAQPAATLSEAQPPGPSSEMEGETAEPSATTPEQQPSEQSQPAPSHFPPQEEAAKPVPPASEPGSAPSAVGKSAEAQQPAEEQSEVAAAQPPKEVPAPASSKPVPAQEGKPRAQIRSGESDLAAARRYLSAGDSQAAARLLWSAVGKGDPDAPVLLADLYLRGTGVSKSCEQARVLLNTAASKRNAAARARLGQMYAQGECAPRDLLAAYRWFSLALASNPENAQIAHERQIVWQQMTELQRQEAQALE